MRGTGFLITDDFVLKVQPERDATGKIIKGIMIGSTIDQNTGLILINRKGEFKEAPALGVGIEDVLLDQDYLAWRRIIRMNLELDEQKVNDVKFSSVDNLFIDAEYNRS